jgi:hypothetical protein
MTPALGLVLLWAWSRLGRKAAGTTSPAAAAAAAPMTASPSTASQAAQAAAAAAQHAAATQKPSAISQALQASHNAANLLQQQAQQITAARKAAAPWPAAKPPDLPPFPAGWEPDVPPPPAVVTRAWQLLPVLWKKGKGSKALETIKGRWITFVAADHGGGKKGVTAFRVKAAATK